MSREIHVRHIVEGWLVLQTPLHVGGLVDSPDTDLALALDGAGRLYVPGTSLAGALRSSQRAAWDTEDEAMSASWLWGDAGQGEQDTGAGASHVVVNDAVVAARAPATVDKSGDIEPLDPGAVEERAGVGIDREWGTAASHILFQRAVIPRGAALHLSLTVDTSTARAADTLSALTDLLHDLVEGRVRLGAGQTRGLGRVRLAKDTATWDSYELATPDGMMSYLRRSESTTASALALLTVRLGSRTRSDDHAVTVEIGWRPVTPVMARASLDGFAIDALPLVSAHEDGGVALVLPGSSIKGSLRSCAERLLRTLPAFHDEPLAGSGDDSRQRFLAQLDQHELITELFGRGGQRLDNGATGESGGDRPLQGRGLLWVDDCYSTTVIGRDTWDELVSSNEAPRQADHAELTPALRQTLRDKGLIETHHVAIDRWTGGAAKGRLYQVLEPQGVQWEPIRLGVDLWRLDGSGGQDLVLGLLLCVLRELRAGRVPLGYGTNRGMGSVAVESLALSEGDIERSISVSGTSDKNPWLDKIASAWGDYANGSGA